MRAIQRNFSYSTTYTFYEPLAGNPRQPDTNAPISLAGMTAEFVVEVAAQQYAFAATVEAANGRVLVNLNAAETATIPKSRGAEAFVRLTSGPDVYKRAAKKVNVK